jgi:hypothetical protein
VTKVALPSVVALNSAVAAQALTSSTMRPIACTIQRGARIHQRLRVQLIKSGGYHVNTPEFLGCPLSAMDDHAGCVPKGRDFDNPPGVSRGARRPIKPLIAQRGVIDSAASWKKTFVDPYTLFFQQTSWALRAR